MKELFPGIDLREYQPSLFSDFTLTILDFAQIKDSIEEIENIEMTLKWRRADAGT